MESEQWLCTSVLYTTISKYSMNKTEGRKLFITTVPWCGKLREQVFSTFSRPCFGVKTIYNYNTYAEPEFLNF
jgi:hypothetical protein